MKQPPKSYRYNLDSFLLLRFAHFKSHENICDLGAGVGVMGLLALERFGLSSVTAVEIQEELALYARQNAQALHLQSKFHLYLQSWQDFAKDHVLKKAPSFDAVISNPPYGRLGEGRLPEDPVRQLARYEVAGNMQNLITSAKSILKKTGRLLLLYPILRLEELLDQLHLKGFKASRLAMIHPYENRPATHVMVEGILAMNRELKVEPPVIVYQDQDHYRPEIEAWVGPKKKLAFEDRAY
ncbi:MAG: methyltransferase [Deltaproteobacteria bacterium]|nr:methyltransferase [Deltaproteobacteria bacterium]